MMQKDSRGRPMSFVTLSMNFSAPKYIKTLPPPGTMPISCCRHTCLRQAYTPIHATHALMTILASGTCRFLSSTSPFQVHDLTQRLRLSYCGPLVLGAPYSTDGIGIAQPRRPKDRLRGFKSRRAFWDGSCQGHRAHMTKENAQAQPGPTAKCISTVPRPNAPCAFLVLGGCGT